MYSECVGVEASGSQLRTVSMEKSINDSKGRTISGHS